MSIFDKPTNSAAQEEERVQLCPQLGGVAAAARPARPIRVAQGTGVGIGIRKDLADLYIIACHTSIKSWKPRMRPFP